MFSLFDATLGGVAFSSIAEEVVLTDIVEEAPRMDTQTAALALRDGMMRTQNRRQSLSIRLVYVIRTQDVALRAELRDKVAAWAAKGGELTINTKPRKRLNVVLDNPPALGSGMRWTDELSVTLTAYTTPYWEDIKPHSISVTTEWAEMFESYFYSGVIKPSGNVKSLPVSALLMNTGEAPLTNIKIVVGNTTIEISGLHMETGANVLSIDYDKNGLMDIRDVAQNESLMHNRTPQSDDDLLVIPGKENGVTIYSDQPIQCSITFRGRWL